MQIGCSYYISFEASFVIIDLILRLVYFNSLLNFSSTGGGLTSAGSICWKVSSHSK
ncbi:MAG: hypothetical protein ACTS80_00345 [Candidatus Hodgkinia cicadicola]